MATVRNTIILQDKMTNVLTKVVTAMNQTVSIMRKVDSTSDAVFDSVARDLAEAQVALMELNAESGKLAPSVEKASNSFAKMKNPIVTISAAIYTLKSGLQALNGITKLADDFILTNARLNLMNDGLLTTSQLQDQILASAQRSRAEYSTTASAIAKMGILAGDNFENTQEIVAFTELLNKSFKIGGSGLQEQTSAMYQLSQAMAAGKLQGDEFRSIMENAPMLAEAIATYMGKTKGELKEMSSQGVITSDIIKNALFGSAMEIEAKFSQLPMTFADATTRIKNQAIESFQPVIEKFSELVNSEKFMVAVTNVNKGFAWLAEVAYVALEYMVAGAEWAGENWGWLEPVIWGVVAAMAGMSIMGMVNAGMIAYTTAAGIATAANQTLTVAQWGLNTALNASPFGWVGMVIGLVIMALVALGTWLYNLWNTNIAFRFGVLEIWNSILGFFDKVPLFFQWVGNGIMDAFAFVNLSVLTTMENMANGVINIVNHLIELLNKIPGVAIKPLNAMTFAAESAVNAEAESQARTASLKAGYAEADAKAQERAIALANQEYIAYRKAEQAKMEAEASTGSNAPGFDFNDFMNNGSVNVDGGNLDSVDKINQDVSITDEDIRLLKDIAKAEFINRYTTLTPNMTVSISDVKETADVNGIVERIAEMLQEAYDSSLLGGATND